MTTARRRRSRRPLGAVLAITAVLTLPAPAVAATGDGGLSTELGPSVTVPEPDLPRVPVLDRGDDTPIFLPPDDIERVPSDPGDDPGDEPGGAYPYPEDPAPGDDPTPGENAGVLNNDDLVTGTPTFTG